MAKILNILPFLYIFGPKHFAVLAKNLKSLEGEPLIWISECGE